MVNHDMVLPPPRALLVEAALVTSALIGADWLFETIDLGDISSETGGWRRRLVLSRHLPLLLTRLLHLVLLHLLLPLKARDDSFEVEAIVAAKNTIG